MPKFEEKKLGKEKRWVMCNGNLGERGGYRAVAVNHYGEYNVVNHVHRHGANTRICTFQVVQDNDYVIIHNFNDELLSVMEFDGGELTEVRPADRRRIMSLLSLGIIDWLEDQSGTPNTLPPGYGWNGERTGSEITKYERVERFLKHTPADIRREILELVIETPGNNMPTSWRMRAKQELPKELELGYDYILFFKRQRDCVVIRGGFKIGYRIPQGVDRIMQISFDRSKHQVSWSLFAKSQQDRVYDRIYR